MRLRIQRRLRRLKIQKKPKIQKKRNLRRRPGKRKPQTQKKLPEETGVLQKAQTMYAQYDYDAAILYLKEQEDFLENKDYMDLAAKCQVAKGSLVEYPLEQVTHVFFHTLIKDTSKAFDGDSDEADTIR